MCAIKPAMKSLALVISLIVLPAFGTAETIEILNKAISKNAAVHFYKRLNCADRLLGSQPTLVGGFPIEVRKHWGRWVVDIQTDYHLRTYPLSQIEPGTLVELYGRVILSDDEQRLLDTLRDSMNQNKLVYFEEYGPLGWFDQLTLRYRRCTLGAYVTRIRPDYAGSTYLIDLWVKDNDIYHQSLTLPLASIRRDSIRIQR